MSARPHSSESGLSTTPSDRQNTVILPPQPSTTGMTHRMPGGDPETAFATVPVDPDKRLTADPDPRSATKNHGFLPAAHREAMADHKV